jgi:hypothetical protein
MNVVVIGYYNLFMCDFVIDILFKSSQSIVNLIPLVSGVIDAADHKKIDLKLSATTKPCAKRL